MPDAKRPNVLILMSDEHSYRFLSHRQGYPDAEPVRTPSLDALARAGVYFDRAYTQMPLCTPARMCFMTGRYAYRCGALGNGAVLDPAIPTLPAHFAAHGYATCLVGKMHFGGSLQFHGFQYRPYGDFGGAPSHQPDPIVKRAAEGGGMRSRTRDAGVTTIPESLLQEQAVVRESLAFLREQAARAPGQPWLLCASFSRPHFPLTAPRRYFERWWPHGVTPPKVARTGDTVDHPMTVGMRRGFRVDEIGPEEGRRARAAYFACVEYLDEVIGDFLACLGRSGLLENTIVVYVTDHGEMAGEHGLWWKNTWHEASVRIPLIFQLPEHREGTLPGGTRTDAAGIIDIFPTLCGAAGLPVPAGVDGVDLRIAEGRTVLDAAEPRLISEALLPRWGPGSEFRVALCGRYKYVAFRAMPELLFDLQADPDEQRNLLKEGDAAVPAEARPALERLRAAVREGFDWDETTRRLREEQERLKARYPKRTAAAGPNQYLLPDGRMVEAETTLYRPHIVEEDPAADFDDFPVSHGAEAPAG